MSPPPPPPPPPPSPPLPHPSTSTLTYLRTNHDVPPKSLLQTRRELTKSALLSSKTHTSLERTRLKQDKKLAEARREQELRPSLSRRPTSLPLHPQDFQNARRGLSKTQIYVPLLTFQGGLAGTLVVSTLLVQGQKMHPKGKVEGMGQRLVFELVLSILVMVAGGLWGAILILLSIRGGKTGKDWLGLREVTSPKQIQDGKSGKRDLEAGLPVGDVRYGYDEKGRERVKIIKICVWDAHRLDHNPPSTLPPNKSHLKNEPIAERLQKSSSSSIPNPPGNRNHSYTPQRTPPTPKISTTPSPLPDPAQREEFIIPPPPPTASRSRASTRPKTWVYTRDIPLDTLTAEGKGEEKRQKTLSLQLGDVSGIDGEREEGDEVFVVGGEEDE